MASEIKLTSQRWNDIIFEGKNKDYGAYDMRKSSSRRHIIALAIIASLVVFVRFLPSLIETLTPERTSTGPLSDPTVLARLELEEQIEEKNIIRDVAAVEPPPLREAIQFTIPEIVDRAQITDDNALRSQDDLAGTTAAIAAISVAGGEEGEHIDNLGLVVVAPPKEADRIFTFVEHEAQFPGGYNAMMNYIKSKVEYPEMAKLSGISEKITVQFVVEKDGSITGVEAVTGRDKSLQAEAVRVVKSMPNWMPGKSDGQPVRTRATVSVDFQAN